MTNKGNLVRKDHQHRFNGELLKTRIEKKNGSTILSTKIFTYELDHLGRKVKFKHALGANEKTIAKYEYDLIGRLNQKLLIPLYKKLTIGGGPWFNPNTWDFGIIPNQNDDVSIEAGHIITIAQGTIANAANLTLKNGAKLLNYGRLNLGGLNGKIQSIAEPGYIKSIQTLNYKYHIRGGLKGINLDANNNLTDNLFSYKLAYEEDGTLFDGNIRNQYWKSNIDGKQRAFGYTYDGASRLKSASYASTQAGEDYSLNNVSYDFNGNITALSRNGATNSGFTSFGLVDNLGYTYQSNSNKLAKIADATTTNVDLGDFRDGTNTDDDYEYWLDGSLKKDKNKKIALITYNYLKLPKTVTFDNGRTITTEYDASGAKLKKIDSNGETTDYEEDEIYVNGVLYQTSHDEGRIVDGVYEYNITDHLGNLRIAFRDKGGVPEITQSIFYDPWGLSMKGMQFTKNLPNFNTFQQNGKEIDLATGYTDFGARMYGAAEARWFTVDPLSETSRRWSPYNFNYNNPLLFIDPDGMSPVYNWGSRTYEEDGEEVSWGYVKNYISGNISNAVAYLTNKADYGKATTAALNDTRNYASKGLGIVFGTSLTEIQSKLSRNYGSLSNLILLAHGGSDGHIEANSNYLGNVVPDDMSINPSEINDYVSGKTSGLWDGEVPQIGALKNIFGQISSGGNCIIGSCKVGNDVDNNSLRSFSMLAGGRINIYANSVNVRYTKASADSQPDYFFNIGGYLNANNNSGTQYSAYSWLGINTSGIVSSGYRINVTGNASNPIKVEKK